MTSTTQQTAYRPEASLSFDALAQRAVIDLEEIGKDTTLPAAHVIAHGLAALTYAVLALRETCESEATDISNTLADIADATADNAARTAIDVSVITAPSWWRRPAWRSRS